MKIQLSSSARLCNCALWPAKRCWRGWRCRWRWRSGGGVEEEEEVWETMWGDNQQVTISRKHSSDAASQHSPVWPDNTHSHSVSSPAVPILTTRCWWYCIVLHLLFLPRWHTTQRWNNEETLILQFFQSLSKLIKDILHAWAIFSFSYTVQ